MKKSLKRRLPRDPYPAQVLSAIALAFVNQLLQTCRCRTSFKSEFPACIESLSTKGFSDAKTSDGSSGSSDEDNEDGGVSIASYFNTHSASIGSTSKKETSLEYTAIATKPSPKSPETFGSVTIVEVFYNGEHLAASTSYNTFAPLAHNDDSPVVMFKNFSIHSPAGGRPSSFFGPTHVLFFSGWMNEFNHVVEFVDNLTVEETAIIRRLAFHDEFFTRHQKSLLRVFKEFYNLEAVFLVSEYIFEDDPDNCLGPYAEPPDHVEFITMQYVMDQNSSPTRQKVPFTPMDRVCEVERAFKEAHNAHWPSPIKVDIVSVKRNGRLRNFDRDLYACPEFPQGKIEIEKQTKAIAKNQKTDEVQQPDSDDNNASLDASKSDFSDNF